MPFLSRRGFENIYILACIPHAAALCRLLRFRLSLRIDARATHARTLLPAAFASVPFGFVLVRVRTDGACSLPFCAAKRSGAFPPNIPAGLRARVSRLSGSTRPFHVLQVIVPPSWSPARCHHGRTGYQPFSLVPNPDGVDSGSNSRGKI